MHGRMLKLNLLTLSLIGVCGCVAWRPPAVAGDVPIAYHAAIPPFEIWSGRPISNEPELADTLGSLRDDVRDTLALATTDRPIEVYVFDDRAAFDRFMQSHYPELPRRRAFFIAQQSRQLVYAFRDDKLGEDLRHEACHALLHAAANRVPLWLDEGLAEYFESADADGMNARYLAETKQAIETGWRPGLTRLEAIARVGQMVRDDYREAWAWVYFLLHESRESRALLVGYVADLRSGTAREPFSSRLFRERPRADAALIDFMRRRDDRQTTR